MITAHSRGAASPDAPASFCQKMAGAIAELKRRLQDQYERAYPGRGELVRKVIAEADAQAWDLSLPFPHLFLPDIAEARIAQLMLEPGPGAHQSGVGVARSAGNRNQ
jgi:hypothetical protein